VKSIAVLVMVVVLVAGLAVNGSRAQPLPVTSVAFRLCQLGEQMPQPCRPIVSPERAALDDGGRDYDGGFAADGGDDGDKHWWDLGVRVALAVARAAAEWWARTTPEASRRTSDPWTGRSSTCPSRSWSSSSSSSQG